MILITKQEYRLHAKETRKKLDITGISTLICANIRALEEYKQAKKIAAFSPYKYEIDINPLFRDTSKDWFFPEVIDEENMVFGENEFDLMIVPALIVDKKGHRLGYGKGYYDRFLAKLRKNCTKVVPIADELIVESLPYDEYDISVDMAVTQSGVRSYI